MTSLRSYDHRVYIAYCRHNGRRVLPGVIAFGVFPEFHYKNDSFQYKTCKSVLGKRKRYQTIGSTTIRCIISVTSLCVPLVAIWDHFGLLTKLDIIKLAIIYVKPYRGAVQLPPCDKRSFVTFPGSFLSWKAFLNKSLQTW